MNTTQIVPESELKRYVFNFYTHCDFSTRFVTVRLESVFVEERKSKRHKWVATYTWSKLLSTKGPSKFLPSKEVLQSALDEIGGRIRYINP